MGSGEWVYATTHSPLRLPTAHFPLPPNLTLTLMPLPTPKKETAIVYFNPNFCLVSIETFLRIVSIPYILRDSIKKHGLHYEGASSFIFEQSEYFSIFFSRTT